jgi:hypothetical protein
MITGKVLGRILMTTLLFNLADYSKQNRMVRMAQLQKIKNILISLLNMVLVVF